MFLHILLELNWTNGKKKIGTRDFIVHFKIQRFPEPAPKLQLFPPQQGAWPLHLTPLSTSIFLFFPGFLSEKIGSRFQDLLFIFISARYSSLPSSLLKELPRILYFSALAVRRSDSCFETEHQ